MISTKTQHFYKGIHYLDLIAHNTQNGGKVLDIKFKKDGNNQVISIKTDYADGLTTTTETLVYHNDILQEWLLNINNHEKHEIFSRNQYNSYLKSL
jgi:hypothetical protein